MKRGGHWKLGAFVLLGLALVVVTVFGLGARSLRKQTVAYTFYFDESVQGLDPGSATKFRGVTVGIVSKIHVAPDRRHVEVISDMDVAELQRLGWVEKNGHRVLEKRPADLRVQLASQGLTGVKFLLIDFYDPVVYPPPELSFDPPADYVPTAKSTLKQLEDSMTKAVDRIPTVVDGLVTIVAKVNAMLDRVDAAGLSDRSLAAIEKTSRLLTSMQAAVDKLDAPGVSGKVKTTLDDLHRTLARLDVVIGRLSDDKGLIASAQRTSDTMGRVARSTDRATTQLEETLRGVQEAAESIQRVADSIEKDPDVLLKGRRKTR